MPNEITYEQAKKIALEYVPKADVYREYPDAFVFYIFNPTPDEAWDGDVVIRKTDGKVIGHFEYVMSTVYDAESAPEKPVVCLLSKSH